MTGCATKESQTTGLERIVFETDVVSPIERLCVCVRLKSSALNHHDVKCRIQKLTCHCDPGRPGTYDAKIGFNHRMVCKIPKIDNHRADLKEELSGRRR